MKQPIYNYTWDPEHGIATCTVKTGSHKFFAISRCHPDDMDMCSEKVGCEIAYLKVLIQADKYYRDHLKAQLAALNDLYYTMKHSTKFNPKSYENKMLQRRIRLLKNDLATAKEMLVRDEQNLKDFIAQREDFYKKIRRNRKINEKGKNE